MPERPRQVAHRHLDRCRAQRTAHVVDLVAAAEEGIGIGALHQHLRHDVQLGGFDGQFARLLRVEQILLDDLRLVDLAVVAFALGLCVLLDLLSPEAVERRELAAVVAPQVDAVVEFERRTDRLALESGRARQNHAQQDVVLRDLLHVVGRLAALHRLLAAAALRRLLHHLDRQRLGLVLALADPHGGRTDGEVALLLRQKHVGDRVVAAAGHLPVNDLNRTALRKGRSCDHVEPLERRGREGTFVGRGVEREFDAHGFAFGHHHRRLHLEGDLFVGRRDRCAEYRQQGQHPRINGSFHSVISIDCCTILDVTKNRPFYCLRHKTHHSRLRRADCGAYQTFSGISA